MPEITPTTNAPKESKALTALREVIESGRPLTYIRSSEEHRLVALLREAARSFFAAPVPLWTWSMTEGLRSDAGEYGGEATHDPRHALDFVAEYAGPAIFHFKDLHEAIRESAEIRRRLRDLYDLCFDRGKYVVITSPVLELPAEIARDLVVLELTVPDVLELETFLHEEMQALGARPDITVVEDDATVGVLARALLGLTLDESRHAVRRAVARDKRLDQGSMAALLEEKRLLVNRTGVIEFIPTPLDIDSIGGLDFLKKWLMERRKLFVMRDEISADIVPKGLLVMGISGCGKSLSAKAIASCFQLPLYRIDMIEIFSGRHGKPEGAFVQTCRMLEQIAPAVVWFDEIEMGITAQTSEASELGRIFAFFLTWMQEKASGLFVAATANRIDLLPAEMIRKGRFDEVFFVDLPTDDERVEIFRIHLKRRGVDTRAFDLERLKKFTKGWTGAECEQCVVAACTTARLEDRAVTEDDVLNATATVVPLSKTMKEQVDHIRSWAYDRAVRASPREMQR